MSAADNLAAAKADALAARRRLTGTIGEVQSRLHPKTIVANTVQDLRDAGGEAARTGLDAVRQRPAAAAGVAAALGLFLARRPLARLFGRKSETASRKKR